MIIKTKLPRQVENCIMMLNLDLSIITHIVILRVSYRISPVISKFCSLRVSTTSCLFSPDVEMVVHFLVCFEIKAVLLLLTVSSF